jgi:glycyl-tRNA synthetase
MTVWLRFTTMARMGVELKNNIKQYWWDAMTQPQREYSWSSTPAYSCTPRHGVASGHVAAFNDPLIDNKDSKKRYRADNLNRGLSCQDRRKDRTRK